MMKAPFAFALAAHHRARASYVAVLIYGSRKTRTFRQHCRIQFEGINRRKPRL
jgi:hypothetical protein